MNWNSSTVPTLAKIINDNNVTHFYGVPEIFRNLNNYFPDLVKLDSVSHFLQAGGKLDPNTISSYVDLCYAIQKSSSLCMDKPKQVQEYLMLPLTF